MIPRGDVARVTVTWDTRPVTFVTKRPDNVPAPLVSPSLILDGEFPQGLDIFNLLLVRR